MSLVLAALLFTTVLQRCFTWSWISLDAKTEQASIAIAQRDKAFTMWLFVCYTLNLCWSADTMRGSTKHITHLTPYTSSTRNRTPNVFLPHKLDALVSLKLHHTNFWLSR